MSELLVQKLLTADQRTWLEALIEKENSGEAPNERVIKIELQDKVRKGFKPSTISSMLLRDSAKITYLGIGLLEPENEIIQNVDKVIGAIRTILVGNPEISSITAAAVSSLTTLDLAQVEKILERLSETGAFHTSGRSGANGWSEISVDNEVFDNYLQHGSIEECIKVLAPTIDYSRTFELAKPAPPDNLKTLSHHSTKADRRKVFVVHGRNLKARDALFAYLRSLDLHPLEWSELVERTEKGSPYIGEILDEAFDNAQAIVVLFTPDDEARLLPEFYDSKSEEFEGTLTTQARPNVLFEAGMAMGRNPDRTILVEIGRLRPFSDIGGRHTIRLTNSTIQRQELAQRLKTAGCAVNMSGTHWHSAGDFESILSNIKEPAVKSALAELTESRLNLLQFVAQERKVLDFLHLRRHSRRITDVSKTI